LARRFQLNERGFALVLKEDNRETWLDNVNVQITFDKEEKEAKNDNKENANKNSNDIS
jgi:hypothetical protein